MLTRETLGQFYRAQIEYNFGPYWLKAIDQVHGGVFTAFDNSGSSLISTDKYTWSQGRFAWILAHLSELSRNGKLAFDPDELLKYADQTVRYIRQNAFLPDGHCAFLLSAEGEPKEPIAGEGYDTSISADCFVIMGLCEYARVAGDRDTAQQAIEMYDDVWARIDRGGYRTEPYPFPTGYSPFSVPMLMLNVSQEVAACLDSLGHMRAAAVQGRATELARELVDEFILPSGAAMELKAVAETSAATLLARHRNPGHAIECMWFILRQAGLVGDESLARRACETIRASLELGWDEVNGGLLRYVDRDGGEPQGVATSGRYEQLVIDTWDFKLWWPHSEALYATLLAWSLTGDEDMAAWYEKVHRYTFEVFPSRDERVGEWVQIRDRRGLPVERVVALPVKDPYHILRNMMLIVELLGAGGSPLPIAAKLV
jgi:N-acylglucosamine 2-epimerase